MHSLRAAPRLDHPVFTARVRWALRALCWTAFAVAAYLAWHAVTQTHVAGCGVGGDSGCDLVLSSSWSKWLGMPVAVLGLACYATLAGLSVMLGVQNPRVARWVNTAFVSLAALAAAASAWFLLLQAFAIGHFCMFCIVTDLCGIAVGGLAVGSAIRWLSATRYIRQSRTATSGLMALRSALPAGKQASMPATPPREHPTPSLAVALGAAGALLVLLVGGQLLFPAKGYEMQQVALEDKIELNASEVAEPAEPQPFEDSRVAMRISPDSDDAGDEANGSSIDSDVVAASYDEPADDQTAEVAENAEDGGAADDLPPENVEPAPDRARERLVSLLNGKLTLDVYKHPHLGSPEAPHVVVEMVSYNCVHCRKTHSAVKRALSRYRDQVCIILMVVPFERGCNKLITNTATSHRGACTTARMALGVAALKPAAFAKFHDFLMADEDEPPPLDRIVARAYGVVSRERLRELSGGEELKKQIAGYVDLFATLRKQNVGNKQFGLPVQIVGDHLMSGTIEKPTDLYEAWEEHLGVKPR